MSSLCIEFWQASLATPIRMRLSPSALEIVQASLEYSEDCRVCEAAGGDDTLMWMSKVCQLPPLAKILNGPAHPARKLFCETLEKCNLTWKGQKLTCGQGLWTCSQYVQDNTLKEAWLSLLGVAPNVNELTKIVGCFRAAEAWTGEKGVEVTEMMKWAWQFMLNMIVFRDALDKDLTTTGLAGRGKEKGLLQLIFVKYDLTKALGKIYKENRSKQEGVVGSEDALKAEVWVKLGSPKALKEHFTPPGYRPKLQDDWEEGEGEEEPNNKNGVSYYCKDQFQAWRKTLPESMDAALADILFGLYSDEFHDFIVDIAEDVAGQSKDEHQKRISAALQGDFKGSPVTPLQGAFAVFQEAYQSKPLSIEAGKSSAQHLLEQPLGDGSTGADFGMEGLDESQARGGEEEDAETMERTKIVQQLIAWRHKHVTFLHPADGKDMDFGCRFALNEMLQRTNFQKDRMTPTHKRLWLVALDLFPPMLQAWVAERREKDFYATHAAFAKQEIPKAVCALLEWILGTRTSDRDWILFLDGRYPQARKVWDTCTEKANLDPGLSETIIIGYKHYPENDFRAPLRRIAYCANKIEMAFMAMPQLKRSSLAAVMRTEFNLCGEESSFECQYTGCNMRSLAEIPMLTPEDWGLPY